MKVLLYHSMIEQTYCGTVNGDMQLGSPMNSIEKLAVIVRERFVCVLVTASLQVVI